MLRKNSKVFTDAKLATIKGKAALHENIFFANCLTRFAIYTSYVLGVLTISLHSINEFKKFPLCIPLKKWLNRFNSLYSSIYSISLILFSFLSWLTSKVVHSIFLHNIFGIGETLKRHLSLTLHSAKFLCKYSPPSVLLFKKEKLRRSLNSSHLRRNIDTSNTQIIQTL